VRCHAIFLLRFVSSVWRGIAGESSVRADARMAARRRGYAKPGSASPEYTSPEYASPEYASPGSASSGYKPFPMRPVAWRLLGLVCLLAAGCAPGRDLPDLPPAAAGPYRLGPGDVVRLITYQEDALTAEFRVSDSGTIALPLIGTLAVAGLSPEALANKVAAALVQRKLLVAPSVAAEVAIYRPIFVLGEVSKPGQYPYQPGMTMVTAAAVAGGFTYRAIDSYASVVRTEDGSAIEGKVTRQSMIAPGDVITVFERRF